VKLPPLRSGEGLGEGFPTYPPGPLPWKGRGSGVRLPPLRSGEGLGEGFCEIIFLQQA